MRLYFGAQVVARHDAVAGHLERLAIDAVNRRLLCLVVHCGEHIGYDVVIPLHVLARASSDAIQLRINAERLDRLPGPVEGGEETISGWRVPHIPELPGPIGWPTHYAFTFPENRVHSNLPPGTVELTNSVVVDAPDGMVGTLAGVVASHDGAIDLLIVRIGTVMRRDILVPIGWVRHLDGVEIELDRARDEVRHLAQSADEQNAADSLSEY